MKHYFHALLVTFCALNIASCGDMLKDPNAPSVPDLKVTPHKPKQFRLDPAAGSVRAEELKACAEAPFVGAWMNKDKWEFYLKNNCLGDYYAYALSVKRIVWFYDPEEKLIVFHEDTKEQKVLDSCYIATIQFMESMKVAIGMELDCEVHGKLRMNRDLALEFGGELPQLEDYLPPK